MDHTIKLKSKILSEKLSDEEFFQFCQEQRDLRIERNSKGEIEIMTPTGYNTGRYGIEISYYLVKWNKQHQLGVAFDSSTGFTLPNGAVRSPDAAWVSNEKHQKLSETERQRFASVCPDFIIELKSPSDQLNALKEKMEEYITNGCQLGWLIDLENEQVHIFRRNGSRETIEGFQQKISGEDVLPGFYLDLQQIKD